jgi:hypothetical protein
VRKLTPEHGLGLNGTITCIDQEARLFTGLFQFAGEDVTARFEVIAAEPGGPDPAPTIRNIRFGPHWRQALDFYKAESDTPTPVVVMIHGGGWNAFDKCGTWGMQQRLMDQGISFASINYRYLGDAREAGATPPVDWPLRDAARGIQMLRHLADELNIDRERIAALGGSSGACSSLWLALHDDMADPDSDDPVARESTRLWCAGGVDAQTSLDPHQMRAWIPTITYGPGAFGIEAKTREAAFDEFYRRREELLPWINEYSPYAHASADDPPIYLENPARGLEPMPGEKGWPTHAPQFAVKLKERLDELGVECYVRYKGKPSARYESLDDFLVKKLKSE